MTVRYPRLNRTRFIGSLLASLVITGCGGGDGPYPVDGKVVFKDGKPATELAGYTVDFELDSGKKFSASGFVNADGSFTVATLKPGDGAMLGNHRVALSPPGPDDERPRPPPAIPDRYRSFQTSGLKAEIKAQRNQILLEVERIKR